MKTKLIGIFISLMLLTTIFATAQPLKNENTLITKTMPITYNVDAPVWKTGDTWTYTIDDISIVKQAANGSISLSLSIGELPLTVISTQGDTYTLEYKTTLNGQIKLSINRGNSPVNVSLTFSKLDISGTVLVDKSNLARKEITAGFKREKISIEIEQSIIPLPRFLQKFSARITMNLKITYDPALSLLTFPLNTGTTWNFSSTNFTVDGTVQSFYLNLINFINKIAKLFGKEFLPPEISALLPVIDIQETLATLGYENTVFIPPIPDALACLNTKNITVPAGTYEAYNITLFGGPAQCYYAPTAGNIVKMIANLEEIDPNFKNINIELLSTNYS